MHVHVHVHGTVTYMLSHGTEATSPTSAVTPGSVDVGAALASVRVRLRG